MKKSLHPDLKPDPILRGKKAGDVFPVAPFYRDLKIAISKAFDRVSDAPIDVALLETYDEALSEYPFRSESKFSNGEYKNSGTTERRHIFVTGINLIGEEADHWEQEYYLGIRNGDVSITYGGDPVEGSRAYVLLRNAIAAFGKFAVHKATGIARATLAKLERGEDAKTNVPHWRFLKAIDQLNKATWFAVHIKAWKNGLYVHDDGRCFKVHLPGSQERASTAASVPYSVPASVWSAVV